MNVPWFGKALTCRHVCMYVHVVLGHAIYLVENRKLVVVDLLPLFFLTLLYQQKLKDQVYNKLVYIVR